MRRKFAIRWLYKRHELERKLYIQHLWLDLAKKTQLLSEAVHEWLALVEESEKANASS